jgi:hypothetical protein
MAGVEQRTVERHVPQLQAAGLLHVTKRTRDDGSRTSNEYRLSVDHDFQSLGSVTKTPGGDGVETPGGVTKSPQEPGREPGTIEPGSEGTSEFVNSQNQKATLPVKSKRATVVDEAFLVAMVERFGECLGGRRGIEEQLEVAVSHASWGKNTDKQAAFRGWLRRSYEQSSRGRPALARPGAAPGRLPTTAELKKGWGNNG